MKPMGFGEPHRTVDLEGPFDKLGTFDYVPLGPSRWLSTFYVLSSLPSPLHTHSGFFVYAKSVFVLRKDGILYFIILKNNGFR